MISKCPCCQSSRVVKKGFYCKTNGDTRRVRKYLCHQCHKNFSAQTIAVSHRDKKPHINDSLFRLLSSGVSQRRAAFIFGVHRKTVARKLIKHSAFIELNQKILPPKPVSHVVFDEMETFEHSKCKPLSIAVAVEDGSRRILSINVAQIPAKGRLTHIALKKYGYRKDHRKNNLLKTLREVKQVTNIDPILKSDECPRYPSLVRQVFPQSRHLTFKGRRGCVVGQGELKAGGFDPLFSLNHTCAMVRDNLKTMSRRTWCTTKDPKRLQHLLNLYRFYHNQQLRDKKRPPTLELGGEAM